MTGRYRILRSLARGGMAEVFEAVALGHGGFERRVAFKRLLPTHEADETFKRMFFDEAQIASQLHHSNVVAVIDYGMLEQTPFQVLEYVDGKDASTLARLGETQGHPMPVLVALHVCAQVAMGLHHAHTAARNGAPLGVVHRDVKPANILISWDGDVKIADFGIAFAKERDIRTVAGDLKGTPAYMAPEQQAGEKVDGRTDVFALGCVLSALVAGASPFASPAANVRLLVGGPTQLDPSLPGDVHAIVDRAVRREPGERYASAAAMADVLVEAFAQRTRRDGKLCLVEWLSLLRDKAPARRGKLDALLDVDVDPGAREESRTFRISRPAEPGLEGPLPGETMQAPPPRPRPARSRTLLGAGALLGLVLVAGVAAIAVRPAARSAAPPTTQPTAPSLDTAAGASAVPSSVEASGETADTPAADAGVARAAEPAVAARAATRPVPVPRGRPAAVPANAAEAVVSTLAVGGGPEDRGTEVIVDGVTMGMAPKYFDVAAGTHSLTFRKPDGRAVGPVRIELLPSHTRRTPLRVSVPP